MAPACRLLPCRPIYDRTRALRSRPPSKTRTMTDRWTPASWRAKPAKHMPDDYPDAAALARVGDRAARHAAAGVRRRGAAAEEPAGRGRRRARPSCCRAATAPRASRNSHADNIRDTFRLILQMAVVLTFAGGKPVVKVGRMAGQFAKPRSAPTETIDGVTLPSYRGDNINGMEFTPRRRTPDPERLLQGLRPVGGDAEPAARLRRRRLRRPLQHPPLDAGLRRRQPAGRALPRAGRQDLRDPDLHGGHRRHARDASRTCTRWSSSPATRRCCSATRRR